MPWTGQEPVDIYQTSSPVTGETWFRGIKMPVLVRERHMPFVDLVNKSLHALLHRRAWKACRLNGPKPPPQFCAMLRAEIHKKVN